MARAELVDDRGGVVDPPGLDVVERAFERGVEARNLTIVEVVHILVVLDRGQQELSHLDTLAIVEPHQLLEERLGDRHDPRVGDATGGV
jgi:hypothetical protein